MRKMFENKGKTKDEGMFICEKMTKNTIDRLRSEKSADFMQYAQQDRRRSLRKLRAEKPGRY